MGRRGRLRLLGDPFSGRVQGTDPRETQTDGTPPRQDQLKVTVDSDVGGARREETRNGPTHKSLRLGDT